MKLFIFLGCMASDPQPVCLNACTLDGVRASPVDPEVTINSPLYVPTAKFEPAESHLISLALSVTRPIFKASSSAEPVEKSSYIYGWLAHTFWGS